MYIRETETRNRATGTVYVKHQLVESIRTDSGPRQRVVMELGHLELDRSQWKKLSSAIADRLSGRVSLIDEDAEIARLAESAVDHYDYLTVSKEKSDARKREAKYVNVDITTAATSFNRSLGAELVANHYYKKVGFDKVFGSLGIDARRQALIKAVIFSRLISPGSELSTLRWINGSSCVSEMLDVDISTVGKDAIYEIGDLLYAKKQQIETMMRRMQRTSLPYKRRLVLFDITNTYFEGSALNNELARFGHSKEKRSDCRLVALGVMVDEMGMPIHSEIYAGNRSEPSTLEEMLDATVPGISPPIEDQLTIVMDRGIATRANLELLRSRNIPYIVIERSMKKAAYVDVFDRERDSFMEVERSTGSSVYVKANETEEGTELLCISEQRAAKERAIDTARQARFDAAVARLNARISKGLLRDQFQVARALEKITSKYPSIAKYYDITPLYDDDSNPDKKKVLNLTVTEKPAGSERPSLYGCYTITTTHKDIPPDEIWRLYMTLVRVEEAFKSLKSDLGLRPVYHQRPDRTAAHLFISVLAYHLMAAIEYDLRASGDTRRWSTIKEILSTHIRSTIIFTDDKDQIHHLRALLLPSTATKRSTTP